MQGMSKPNKCEELLQSQKEQYSQPSFFKIIAAGNLLAWPFYTQVSQKSNSKQSADKNIDLEDSNAMFLESQEEWFKNIVPI